MKMPQAIGLVHFIGIGGIGMSGIAEVLCTLGYTVSGSDLAEGAATARLREQGVRVEIGHRAETLREADVVLAVGTRLQPQQQNWGLDDTLKIIRIDADSEELDRQRKPEIGIVGDATATLKVLADRLEKHARRHSGRAAHVAAIKAVATKKMKPSSR